MTGQPPSNPQQPDDAHPADALEALARGEHHSQAEPDSDDAQDALEEEIELVPAGAADAPEPTVSDGYAPDAAGEADNFDPPGDPADALGGFAAETAPAAPTRTVRRPAPQQPNLALRRIGIPVMAAVALLMFVIGAWAIMVLIGVDALVRDASDPTTRKMAIIMLFAFPIGLVLLAGCWLFSKDLAAAKKRNSSG